MLRSEPKSVLVVEDEPDIRRLVALHLREIASEVVTLADGAAGLDAALERAWDLIVLDLMLPGASGLEICRRVRANEEHGYCPILMLTAKSDEIDRVLGLESGADDYLTKPFSVRELVARVRAIFRRVDAFATPPGGRSRTIEVGLLRIDTRSRTVALGGEPIHLTATEFDLLALFAAQPKQVFSRGELLERVWGYGHDGYEHTVNSHINRLRSKIEREPSQPRLIETVWGVGYRLSPPAIASDDAARPDLPSRTGAASCG